MKKHLIVISTLFFYVSFGQIKDTLELNSHPSKIILPSEIDENSGLVFVKDYLFTFNDSGGNPEIFVLDINTGNIKNTILLQDAFNIDWESITTDGDNIYVADSGNNRGNRKNLAIYKVRMQDIDFTKIYQEVESTRLAFEIEGQNSFEDLNRNNNYDIESIVFYNNKIHFFTKEWVSLSTTHHTLDPNLTNQISKKIETFPVGYVVTDATLDKNHLILVGYTKESLAFLSTFKITDSDYFFKNPLKKFFIGLTPSIGQIEGIATSDKNIFISGEAVKFNGFSSEQVLYTLEKMY